MIVAIGLGILGFIGLAAYMGGRFLYGRMPGQVVLYEMDATALVKPLAPVSVRSELGEYEIPIKLPEHIALRVPVREVLDVPVEEIIEVPLDMAVKVPIDQDIFVKSEFPLALSIPLEGMRVKARLLGFPAVPVALQGSLPVKLNIPFERKVHIKADMEVPFKKVIKVPFRKILKVPLKLDLNIDLPVQRLIRVDFDGPLKLKTTITEEMPVRARFRIGLTKEGGIVVDPPLNKGMGGGKYPPPEVR